LGIAVTSELSEHLLLERGIFQELSELEAQAGLP
jgi:hypothetical protein